MEKRILYIATSDIHLATFHKPYLKWLSGQGYKVDIAVENRGNLTLPGVYTVFNLDFPRSLFKKALFTSYLQLKKIIEDGNYHLIHCHTPIPSLLTRLSARSARKKGTKVLYTAHGFHFFKGAPLKNWLFYYPAEIILSRFTDAIITINKEDFGYIYNKMFHKHSFYIKGIGVDSTKFKTLGKEEIKDVRIKLGYTQGQFILLYVAEFIPRKNHQFIINSIPTLIRMIPELKVIFTGKGILLDKMKQLAKDLHVAECVDFLGFRQDVHLLSAISDVGISSSKHEGLGLGLAEEMLCSVPIVATVDKGHKEMMENGLNGFFYNHEDSEAFQEAILNLYFDPDKRKLMGLAAHKKAQEFTIESSLKSMAEIYLQFLK